MSDHESRGERAGLLDVAVHVPEHVIFRSFAEETVALNLQTGTFHGLNTTAGRMVELVARARRARDAVGQLAEEYGVPDERIADDLEDLLRLLVDRRLIKIDE
jgi:coenzyme PQQ synthesis protein D (PqqD)